MTTKNDTGKYLVQVGRHTKGAYETRYSLDDRGQAGFWYAGINIGRGYKKRLVAPDGKVIAWANS